MFDCDCVIISLLNLNLSMVEVCRSLLSLAILESGLEWNILGVGRQNAIFFWGLDIKFYFFLEKIEIFDDEETFLLKCVRFPADHWSFKSCPSLFRTVVCMFVCFRRGSIDLSTTLQFPLDISFRDSLKSPSYLCLTPPEAHSSKR